MEEIIGHLSQAQPLETSVLAQGALTLSQVLCVGHGQLVTSGCSLHGTIFPAVCLLRGALKVQKVVDTFISVIRHFKALPFTYGRIGGVTRCLFQHILGPKASKLLVGGQGSP